MIPAPLIGHPGLKALITGLTVLPQKKHWRYIVSAGTAGMCTCCLLPRDLGSHCLLSGIRLFSTAAHRGFTNHGTKWFTSLREAHRARRQFEGTRSQVRIGEAPEWRTAVRGRRDWSLGAPTFDPLSLSSTFLSAPRLARNFLSHMNFLASAVRSAESGLSEKEACHICHARQQIPVPPIENVRSSGIAVFRDLTRGRVTARPRQKLSI